MNLTATPEQLTAHATVWLTAATWVLAVVTLALWLAAWRTFVVTKEGLKQTGKDLQDQLRLATDGFDHTLRQTTVQDLAAWLRRHGDSMQKLIELMEACDGSWRDRILEADGMALRNAAFPALADAETLAIGVDCGVYDFDLVRRLAGPSCVSLWTMFEPLITKMRTEEIGRASRTPDACEELEKLVFRLKAAQLPESDLVVAPVP